MTVWVVSSGLVERDPGRGGDGTLGEDWIPVVADSERDALALAERYDTLWGEMADDRLAELVDEVREYGASPGLLAALEPSSDG